MLQNSPVSGVLFLAGILAGSLGLGGSGHMAVFVGAVAALMMVTPVSAVASGYGNGLAGFNAVLVGCAAYTFFSAALPTWLWVAAVCLTLPVKRACDLVFAPAGISSLTLPFILLTWLLLYVGPEVGASFYVAESIVEIPDMTLASVLAAWLKGVSQVFLIDSWLAGILMLAGLCAAGWRVALWAMAGSAMGMVLALVCGCGWEEVSHGLWGFSPVLTAIAVGVTFRVAGFSSMLWYSVTLGAIVLTFVMQWLLTPALGSIGLPILTLPFCLATWFTIIVLKTLQNSSAITKKALPL